MRIKSFLAVLAVATAACGAEQPSIGEETTSTIDTSTTTETEATSTVPDSEPEQMTIVDQAKADLSQRLGVDPALIEVVSSEQVTWPDGSLGCPEPDMSYTQALVDGWKILLGQDGRVYAYHAGDDGEPFLCPSEEKDGGYEFVPPPGFND